MNSRMNRGGWTLNFEEKGKLVAYNSNAMYKQFIVIKKENFKWEVFLDDRFTHINHTFFTSFTKKSAMEYAYKLMSEHPEGWDIEGGEKINV